MKRNYVINYCCALLALILLICGAGVFFINVKAPKAAQPLEGMIITDAEPLEYYTADFLIVDIYAYYGDSAEDASAYFCYALVKDKNGNTQAVSFSTTELDGIFPKVKEYACNEESQIGDLTLECAAKALRMTSYPDYIDQWYNETEQTYHEMLGTFSTVPINFEFFSESDEFIESRKADQKKMLVISTVCTCIGAISALASFLLPGIKAHAAQPWLWEQKQNEQNESTAENTESNE